MLSSLDVSLRFPADFTPRLTDWLGWTTVFSVAVFISRWFSAFHVLRMYVKFIFCMLCVSFSLFVGVERRSVPRSKTEFAFTEMKPFTWNLFFSPPFVIFYGGKPTLQFVRSHNTTGEEHQAWTWDRRKTVEKRLVDHRVCVLIMFFGPGIFHPFPGAMMVE